MVQGKRHKGNKATRHKANTKTSYKLQAISYKQIQNAAEGRKQKAKGKYKIQLRYRETANVKRERIQLLTQAAAQEPSTINQAAAQEPSSTC